MVLTGPTVTKAEELLIAKSAYIEDASRTTFQYTVIGSPEDLPHATLLYIFTIP